MKAGGKEFGGGEGRVGEGREGRDECFAELFRGPDPQQQKVRGYKLLVFVLWSIVRSALVRYIKYAYDTYSTFVSKIKYAYHTSTFRSTVNQKYSTHYTVIQCMNAIQRCQRPAVIAHNLTMQ